MAEDLRGQAPASTRSGALDWLLWWRIDPDQLDHQVAEYATMPFRQTMRGVSVICLGISILATVVMMAFGVVKIYALIDVAILLPLACFAIGPGIFIQVIWWAIYMHAFYFAFRVEQHRRSLPATAQADVFN